MFKPSIWETTSLKSTSCNSKQNHMNRENRLQQHCQIKGNPNTHGKPRSAWAYASMRWHRTSIFMLGCHCNSGGKCCPNAHLHRGNWGSQRLRSCPGLASMKLGVWASIFPSRKREDKSTAPVGRTFLVRAPVGIRFTCRGRQLRTPTLTLRPRQPASCQQSILRCQECLK